MSEGRSRRRGALAAGMALIAAAFASLCPGVFVGETLFLRDLSVFHRPLRRVLLDLHALSDGVPVWNPYSHFGQPFAANPNAAVFDPFTALHFLLPFDPAFNLEVLLPLLVGAAGFAWLVSERGGSRAASLFGALGWGLGGVALSVSGYLQLHHAIALLPCVLAATLALVRSPSSRRVALLGAALAVQGLAGSPSALLITALLLPFAVWDASRLSGLRRGAAASLLLALIAGGLASAATWAPAAAHLRHTARVADPGFQDESAGWSLPPARLLELVAPRAFGHVVPETVGWYWGRGLYGWRQWPYFFSLYASLPVLVLALACAARRTRAELPWLLGGALGGLLAFGEHLPAWEWLQRGLPPLGLVRFPEKWAVAPALVLALLAARGFDLLREDPAAASAARRLATALAAGLGAGAIVARFATPASWAERVGVPDWLAGDVAARAGSDWTLQFLLALSLAALLFLARSRPALAAALLLVLTATDLSLAGRPLMPTAPPAHFDVPPEALRSLAGWPDGGYLFQYADWKKHEVRRGGRELVVEPPAPWQWGIATGLEKDFDGTQFAWSRSATSELLELMAREPELVATVLGRRGISAVLTPGSAADGGRALSLLRTRSRQPLAFVAERVLVRAPGEGLGEALGRLDSGGSGTVVLEAGARVPSRPGAGRAEIESLGPERWRVRVSVPGPEPAVLALNTTWHPRARVLLGPAPGGTAASPVPAALERLVLFRADGHLSAVVVPPGRHVLSLEHRAPAVGVGLLVSLAGLLVILGLLAGGSLPRRDGEVPGAMAS